jgi:prepilin-type processing-associated H-X9-DG protein
MQNVSYWDSSGEQKVKRLAGDRGPLPGIGPLYMNPWAKANRTLIPGVWCITKPTKLKDITDGTATTVLLGEKAHIATADGIPPIDEFAEEKGRRRRTFWAYTYTSYQRSVTFLQTRSIISDYTRCLNIPGWEGEDPCKRSWGSLHPSGFNITLCDGSVQFISDSIDIFVFGAMSTIAAGDIVQQQ